MGTSVESPLPAQKPWAVVREQPKHTMAVLSACPHPQPHHCHPERQELIQTMKAAWQPPRSSHPACSLSSMAAFLG